jgi:hypothetical protein
MPAAVVGPIGVLDQSNATAALQLLLVSRWGGLLITAGGHAVQFVIIGLCKDGDPG